MLGTILSETKHINLSLHFLEQVIICLQVSTCLAEGICESRVCNPTDIAMKTSDLVTHFMRSLQLPCISPPVRLLRKECHVDDNM